MKNALFFVAAFLFPFTLIGQAGWQWGRTGAAALTPGLDVMASELDDSGYVVSLALVASVSGPLISPFEVFGSDTVFNPGSYQQQILFKSDSTGHFLWAQGSQGAHLDIGGMTTDPWGNSYVLNMYYGSSGSFGPITLSNPSYPNMLCLVKYSPGGNVVWAHNLFGNPKGYVIGSDAAGNIYFAAGMILPSVILGSDTLYNTSPAGDTADLVVARLDTSGAAVWARSFGGPENENPSAIDVSAEGDIYLAGSFNSRTWSVAGTVLTDSLVTLTGYHLFRPFLMKLDNSGHAHWAQSLSGKVLVEDIAADETGHFYLCGGIDSTVIMGADTVTTHGSYDALIVKYDTAGHVIWTRTAGGTLVDEAQTISIDKCSNSIWVAGELGIASAYTFLAGADTITGPSPVSDPMFVLKYNTMGSYDTGFALASGGDDWVFVLPDGNGYFYLVGDFKNMSMVFGADTLLPQPYSYEALMLARYWCDTVCSIGDVALGNRVAAKMRTFALFPNPAGESCTINANPAFGDGTSAEILDLTGRLLAQYPLSGNSRTIPLGGIASGMYICRIITADGYAVSRKLVVTH